MSISENVSEQLEASVQEALEKIENKKPKRHRRTKAEIENEAQIKKEKENQSIKSDTPSHIIAIVDEWDTDGEDVDLPRIIEIPDSLLVGDYDIDTISDYISNTTGFCHKGFKIKWPEHHDNHDQFCQWEIEKAHLNGKPDPDFDFRNLYENGSKIYFVRKHDSLNEKIMHELTLRTIYPRMLVGVMDKNGCQCIGYGEKDYIFINRQDAKDYYDSLDGDIEEFSNENMEEDI